MNTQAGGLKIIMSYNITTVIKSAQSNACLQRKTQTSWTNYIHFWGVTVVAKFSIFSPANRSFIRPCTDSPGIWPNNHCIWKATSLETTVCFTWLWLNNAFCLLCWFLHFTILPFVCLRKQPFDSLHQSLLIPHNFFLFYIKGHCKDFLFMNYFLLEVENAKKEKNEQLPATYVADSMSNCEMFLERHLYVELFKCHFAMLSMWTNKLPPASFAVENYPEANKTDCICMVVKTEIAFVFVFYEWTDPLNKRVILGFPVWPMTLRLVKHFITQWNNWKRYCCWAEC